MPEAGVLANRFRSLLSEDIRPHLRGRGFAKSGSTFLRRRDPLYDVINFQGSSRNGLGAVRHTFFVNVGTGSSTIDAVSQSEGRPFSLSWCLVKDRWENRSDTAPPEVSFGLDTDLASFAALILGWLDEVLERLDAITGTDDLVDQAIASNYLFQLEKTCTYLVHSGDTERLARYVDTVRTRFLRRPGDSRWPVFRDRIAGLAAPFTPDLRAAGLLDDLDARRGD